MAKKLKTDWFAASEQDLHPQLYPAGTELTGDLLDRAEALGLVADEDHKPKPAGRKK